MNSSIPSTAGGSKAHYVVGLLLFITGLLVILIGISLRSQADNSSSSASVNNIAPTVDTITISESTQGNSASSINVNENSDKTVYVHGQYTDNNGCSEVSSQGNYSLVLYRSGVTNGASCTADNASCLNSATTNYGCNFSMTSNPCSGGTDTTADYQCSVPLKFFADPTDAGSYSAQNWIAKIVVTDNSSATDNKTATMETNTLTALDVTSAINFGALALNASTTLTSAAGALTVTNTGNNNALNIGLSGTDMACSVGSIPVAKLAYTTGTWNGFYGNYSKYLSGSNVSAGMAIAKGAASTATTYWGLHLPSSGLSGSCAGAITFNAQ